MAHHAFLVCQAGIHGLPDEADRKEVEERYTAAFGDGRGGSSSA